MKSLAALLLLVATAHGQQVTFYKHLAPILYKECATGHRPGESAPFSLLTYEDARKVPHNWRKLRPAATCRLGSPRPATWSFLKSAG